MFAGCARTAALCFILAALGASPLGSSVAFAPNTPGFDAKFTPTAVNDSGAVSGIYGSPVSNGALWQRGAMNVFGPITSDTTGINNAGAIIGNVRLRVQNGAAVYQPYLYSGGHVSTVRGPGFSNTFTAINDAGLIVGMAQSATGVYSAVVYPKNAKFFEPFSAAKYTSSTATAVNNAGEYIGTFLLRGSSVAQPYIGRGANIRPLPFTGHVVAINDAGTIIGYRETAGGTSAFMWSAAQGLTQLPTLPNTTHAYPSAINNRGEIVGHSYGSGVSHAFLYSGGRVIDLNQNASPIGITDRGDILFENHTLPGGFLLKRR